MPAITSPTPSPENLFVEWRDFIFGMAVLTATEIARPVLWFVLSHPRLAENRFTTGFWLK